MGSAAAEAFARARHRAGLTQAELGRRAGVAQSVVSAYENGRRRPSVDVLERLIAATGAQLSLTDVPAPASSGRPLGGSLGQRVADLRQEIKAIAGRFGATNVRVFGSVTRGVEHEESDIDLLVDLAPGTGLLTVISLERELHALSGAAVDVAPADDVRTRIRHEVLADAVPL